MSLKPFLAFELFSIVVCVGMMTVSSSLIASLNFAVAVMYGISFFGLVTKKPWALKYSVKMLYVISIGPLFTAYRTQALGIMIGAMIQFALLMLFAKQLQKMAEAD